MPVADGFTYLGAADPDRSANGNAARPLYEWLAEWSARVLIPGGHLVVYTGDPTLPRDIAILAEQLTCRGECVSLLTQQQRLHGAGLL
jgi:hypothetical protein